MHYTKEVFIDVDNKCQAELGINLLNSRRDYVNKELAYRLYRVGRDIDDCHKDLLLMTVSELYHERRKLEEQIHLAHIQDAQSYVETVKYELPLDGKIPHA